MDTSFAIRDLKAFHVVGTGNDYWGGAAQSGESLADRYQFKPGWQTVYARRVESPVVRIRLADGSVGWGEACAPICPEVVCLLLERLAAPLVVHRDFGHPSACWDLLYGSNHCRGYADGYWLDAIAALDIAIWDALGHRARLPVAALLSPSPRPQIDTYLSGPRAPTQAERIDLLRTRAAEGLRAVKLFVTADVDAACAELQALQRGVPAIERWMVDALWSFDDADKAAAAKRALSTLGVEWLECPLQPEDLEGHRALVSLPGSRIALGEHFRTHFQASPWIAQRALDILQPDIARMGFTEGMRLADIAANHDVPTTPHAGSGLLVVRAAALQFACAWPTDLPCEYQASLVDEVPGALHDSWTFANGSFRLPDRPGLGVEVDENVLARYVKPH
jgi:galactonate dehydratase